MSSFSVHQVQFIGSQLNPLLGSHARKRHYVGTAISHVSDSRHQTGSSDRPRTLTGVICGDSNYRSTDSFPLDTEPELVHYFSKRVRSMSGPPHRPR